MPGPGTHGTNLCGATTRSGKSCRNKAGKGTPHPGVGRCSNHGGSTPNQITHALPEYINLQAHRLGLRVDDITPEEAILDSIRDSAANVAIYRHLVNQLSLEMGDEIMSMDEDGHLKITANAAIAGYTGSKTEPNKAAPHIFVTLYNDERDRLFNYAATATRIGLSERMVRIAERQGEKLVEVLEAVFNDPEAQLDATAADRLRGVTAKHLRLVTVDS
jgi:hypothetical protein